MDIKQAIVIKTEFYVPGSKSHNWYRSNKVTKKGGGKGSPKSWADYVLNKGNVEITKKTNNDTNRSYLDYQTRSGRAEKHFWTNQENDAILDVPKDSLVWDMVISFDKQYAHEEGIESIEQTKILIDKTIGTLFLNNGLDPKNMAYVAVHHNDTDNHHIHLRINEIKPSHVINGSGHKEFRKKGKFKEKTFEIMKQHIDMVSKETEFMWSSLESRYNDLHKTMIDESFKQQRKVIPIAQQVVNVAKNANAWKYGRMDKTDQKLIDSYFGHYLKATNLQNEYKHFKVNRTDEFKDMKLKYPDYFDAKENEPFRNRSTRYDNEVRNDFIQLCRDISERAPDLPKENFALAGKAQKHHQLQLGAISNKRIAPVRSALDELMNVFNQKHKTQINQIDEAAKVMQKLNANWDAAHREGG